MRPNRIRTQRLEGSTGFPTLRNKQASRAAGAILERLRAIDRAVPGWCLNPAIRANQGAAASKEINMNGD